MKSYSRNLALLAALVWSTLGTAYAQSFTLQVNPTHRSPFFECMTLAADGTLSFANSTLTLSWIRDPADKGTAGGFVATSDGADKTTTLRLSLHGQIFSGIFVAGNAVNSKGQTYTFTGQIARTCKPDRDDAPVKGFEAAEATGFWATPAKAAPIDPSELPRTPPPSTTPIDPRGPGSLVAGRSFAVSIGEVGSTRGFVDECWTFTPDGVLYNSAMNDLIWRHDEVNQSTDAFQATGGSASRHGLGLHGSVSATGELFFSGLRSVERRVTGLVGLGLPVEGC